MLHGKAIKDNRTYVLFTTPRGWCTITKETGESARLTQPQGLAVSLFVSGITASPIGQRARLFVSLHDVYEYDYQVYQSNDKHHRGENNQKNR
jgi:hypothetical protein